MDVRLIASMVHLPFVFFADPYDLIYAEERFNTTTKETINRLSRTAAPGTNDIHLAVYHLNVVSARDSNEEAHKSNMLPSFKRSLASLKYWASISIPAEWRFSSFAALRVEPLPA